MVSALTQAVDNGQIEIPTAAAKLWFGDADAPQLTQSLYRRSVQDTVAGAAHNTDTLDAAIGFDPETQIDSTLPTLAARELWIEKAIGQLSVDGRKDLLARLRVAGTRGPSDPLRRRRCRRNLCRCRLN